MTPECLKENNVSAASQLLGLGAPGSPSLNNSVHHQQQPSMPLHPAGIIPGPGGDLNGHMNSSNISPSGGAGAPTHLSSLSGGKFLFDFPRFFRFRRKTNFQSSGHFSPIIT